MSKSRSRRKHGSRRGTPTTGRRVPENLPPQLRRDWQVIRAVDEAEARGDARAALGLIEHDVAARAEHVEGFWRPGRVLGLWQIALFGPVLPRWVTSRWVLAQAAHWTEPSRRRLWNKTLDTALEIRGGSSTLQGRDRYDEGARVMDHDWVHRQLWLYEFGALEHFLRRVASGDLLTGAEQIHAWAKAPMGAFRLVVDEGSTLTWHDLGADREVETVNLGAASSIGTGECGIGRLVPVAGGVMFESAPLHLPEDLAARVADDPVDWMSPVAEGCRRTQLDQLVVTGGHDFGLTTDVPIRIQDLIAVDVVELLDEFDFEPQEDFVATGRELMRAAMDDRLPWGGIDLDPWPTIAAVLLAPSVFTEFVLGLDPSDAPDLRRLADRLAGPAAAVCRAVADDLAGRAGSRSA